MSEKQYCQWCGSEDEQIEPCSKIVRAGDTVGVFINLCRVCSETVVSQVALDPKAHTKEVHLITRCIASVANHVLRRTADDVNDLLVDFSDQTADDVEEKVKKMFKRL